METDKHANTQTNQYRDSTWPRGQGRVKRRIKTQDVFASTYSNCCRPVVLPCNNISGYIKTQLNLLFLPLTRYPNKQTKTGKETNKQSQPTKQHAIYVFPCATVSLLLYIPFTKPPLFQWNRLIGGSNPTFESYLGGEYE